MRKLAIFFWEMVSEIDVSCETFSMSPHFFNISGVQIAEEMEKEDDNLVKSFIVNGGI